MPMDILADPMMVLGGPPLSAPLLPLILWLGDSQFVGEDSTDSADPAFNVAPTQSTTFVKNHDFHYALAANDPLVFQTDITGGVRPYTVGGSPGMNPQVCAGQVLTAAQLTCVMASYAVFGMAVKQEVPLANYPTTPPNVFTQLTTRVHALETTWSAQTRVIIISGGGNDGANNTDAGNLSSNMALLLAGLQTAFPGATIIWLLINADTVNAPGFVGMATAISQQASFFAANPSVKKVVTDDCALLGDHAHFRSDTSITVGQRLAFTALDALSVARAHPVTFPAVLGFGPETFSNGSASANPHSWGGAQAGHLEILVAATLTAAGTNNTITTPSGWVLIGTASSTSGGSITRAAFYRRAVDGAMISGNNGWTAPTTVLAANSNEFSEIITIGGPNANPTVEASAISANNAFGTSAFVMTGVTTLGANRTIVMITVAFRTNATANPITITDASLSGITVIKNGTRDSGLSNFCTIDVQTAQLAVAGATGNPSGTPALGSLSVGAVLAIAP